MDRASIMWVYVISLIALSNVIIANAGSIEDNPLFGNYLQNQDLEDFCGEYRRMFKRNCKLNLPESIGVTFRKIIKSNDYDKLLTFIDEEIMVSNPDLDMDDVTCHNLKTEMKDVSNDDMATFLNEQLKVMGYHLEALKFHSAGTLRRRVDKIRATSSCNLEIMAKQLGIIKKIWLPKISIPSFGIGGVNVQGIIEGLKNFVPEPSSSVDSIDKEIVKEREEREALNEAQRKHEETLKQLEKDCYMDANQKACDKMHRVTDEFIMDNLGSWAIRLVRSEPSLRDCMYGLAKLKRWYDRFHMVDRFELIAKSIQTSKSYWQVILAVSVVIFIGYRSELKTMTSCILAYAGLSIIPALTVGRFVGRSLLNRVGGLMVSGAVLLTTAGLSYGIVTPTQSCMTAYACTVVYVNMVNPGSSRWIPILSFGPLVAYGLLKDLDFEKLVSPFERIPTGGLLPQPQWRFSYLDIFRHEIPDLYAVLAIAIGVSIYTLCNYCDVIGYASYRDVVNIVARSKPLEIPNIKITIVEYISSFFCFNTLVLVGCLATPGLMFQGTWVVVMAVILFSIVASAVVYHTFYHDEYIREAKNTSSAKELLSEPTNVIAGMAPKNVLLPRFHRHVQIGLVAMAILSGCRINYMSGATIGSLVAVALYNKPYEINLCLSWFNGLALLLCGTVPHAIIGMIYLACRVGRSLRMATSSMGLGETFRELEVS